MRGTEGAVTPGRARAGHARWAALTIVTLACAGMMVRSWLLEPPEPSLPQVDWHGANRPGDLTRALVVLGVECLVVVGVLRPWSYGRRWRRALWAGLLLTPWTLFLLSGLHLAPVLRILTLWNLGAVAFLVAMATWDVVWTRRARAVEAREG